MAHPLKISWLVVGAGNRSQKIVINGRRCVCCYQAQPLGYEVTAFHLPQLPISQVGNHPARHSNEVRPGIQLVEADNPRLWLELPHDGQSKRMTLQDAAVVIVWYRHI